MVTTTQLDVVSGTRPEAMADVPGVCELPLTRAVVQYRDLHQLDLAGGRIEDIGLAVVLEGRHPSAAEALDLGSAELKRLDLSTELVVLDWVYQPTLDHLAELLESRTRSGSEPGGRSLGPYCFELARHVVSRVGFGPLTRPTLLRIGFRDVCRDLDFHEGTSVRIVPDPGRLVRAHLDYDACALLFRTVSPEPDSELEDALAGAFAARDVRRVERVRDGAPVTYQVRFPLPLSLDETREILRGMRGGLARLLARFEPRRYRAARETMDAFGARETLARLRLREPRVHTVPLGGGAGDPPASSETVH